MKSQWELCTWLAVQNNFRMMIMGAQSFNKNFDHQTHHQSVFASAMNVCNVNPGRIMHTARFCL